jgi:hypothetical protein
MRYEEDKLARELDAEFSNYSLDQSSSRSDFNSIDLKKFKAETS